MKIQKELFMDELQVVLKDEFTAVVSKNGNKLILKFLNGQEFTLIVKG